MSEFDTGMLIGLHKLAAQNGDGLIPELLERLQDLAERERDSAEIVALPGLHERKVSRSQHLANGLRGHGDAAADNVVAFPAPRWQQNAVRNGKV
ncbi:hypothetical protein [Rhizobium sp. RU36D]|uniref:hypothetical protein n=1 Tax=Rhizobium sp. RU36D TaxID=1907415 RepID=UPI0009D8A831|nr:hypothetical protein [Rhizobium sp. RU36D]SMC39300.1 hypothetical protein SAMN05880593_10113 [Rhizobium sp. RU36D]